MPRVGGKKKAAPKRKAAAGPAAGTTRDLLPQAPAPPALTITADGDWIPLGHPQLEAEAPAEYLCRVEYAKSSRGKCRMCCTNVGKGEIKVGVPTKWGRKDMGAPFGWGNFWAHLACARVPGHTAAALEPKVHGLAALASAADRKAVLREITRKDKPKCMENEVKPEDADFLAGPSRAFRHPSPPELTQPLLPFQEEGLGWMLAQEETAVKGGILADEMGMGKTVQAISLILASRAERKKDAKLGPTLVVAPTSAMWQWAEEIENFTNGSLKVLVYYTTREKVTKEKLLEHDVVLTTYPVLEMEYRSVVDEAKVQCQYCQKMFLPRTLITHLKYFCGPEAEKTAKLKLREKKQKVANEKAMRTLKIKSINQASAGGVYQVYADGEEAAAPAPAGKRKAKRTSVPSISNVYKELMEEAGREPMSMFDSVRRPAADGKKVLAPPRQKAAAKGKAKAKPKPKAKPKAKAAPKAKGKGKGKAKEEDPDFELEDEEGEEEEEEEEDGDSSDSDLAPANKKVRVKEKPALRTEAAEFFGEEGAEPQCRPVDAKALMARQKNITADLADTSTLHGMAWQRIILDEAHKIKARTTSTAKSVYNLKAKYKWALTGTPLQNRVGDLFSLVRFLEMDPYAYYFCRKKGCDCKSLEWNFGPMQRQCECCGHPAPYHYSAFNKAIINPISRYGYVGEGQQAVKTLQKVLNAIQLRRTKKQKAADVKLPPLNILVKYHELSEQERDFYESLYKESSAKFDTYVKKGTLLHNYAHIFELISRLRQAVNHPYLVTLGKGAQLDRAAADAYAYDGPEARKAPAAPAQHHVCAICHEGIAPEEYAAADCGHEFHRECVLQYITTLPVGAKLKCPACFTAMTIDLDAQVAPPEAAAEDGTPAKDAAGGPAAPPAPPVKAKKKRVSKKSILSRIDPDHFASSSKVELLLKEVQGMLARAPGSKGIVFSQYTHMLEIVEWRLEKLGVKTTKLLGSMPAVMRRSVLAAFKADPSINVILLSLKAGGEGLNLQIATHVFVIEPWWNPAVEMQAIQRAHRIGQTKAVTAVRFATKGTIEERMMQLQEKKQLVFDGTIDNSAEAMQSLNKDDLAFLFRS